MKKIAFISIDLQNEFASVGGKFYSPKPAVDFLKNTLFPFLQNKEIKINEIISDYRSPRPGDRGDGCHPGTWGYESLIPDSLRKSLWVKCMNSPVWVRNGIGDKDKKPGLPYPDPKLFSSWLVENIGDPNIVTPILFGLTIDCCVMSTAQELNWRGYYPKYLIEGVDHASGKIVDRDKVLETPASNWAEPVKWEVLRKQF